MTWGKEDQGKAKKGKKAPAAGGTGPAVAAEKIKDLTV
jgi:hypothetical protein